MSRTLVQQFSVSLDGFGAEEARAERPTSVMPEIGSTNGW
jgi:hypothetical protein